MLPSWFFILFYFFVMLVLCSLQYVTLLQFVRMALHELFFLLGGEPLQLIHEVIIHRTSFFCVSPQHRLSASANKRTCYWIRCRDKGSYTVIYFHFFKFFSQLKWRKRQGGGGATGEQGLLSFVRLFHSVPWIGSWRQFEIRLSNEALNKVMINCQTLSNDILHPRVPSLE